MLRAALAGAATLLLVLVAALTTMTTGSAPIRGQVVSASPQALRAVPKAPEAVPSATVTATPKGGDAPRPSPSPRALRNGPQAVVATSPPGAVTPPAVRSVTNSPLTVNRSGTGNSGVASADLPAGLLCIRGPWNGYPGESNANYRAVSPFGDGGGYQYQPRTWGGFGGYPRAELAPPAVQDARALADYLMGTAMRHMLWPNTSRRCGV